jgi:hypothetical protein
MQIIVTDETILTFTYLHHNQISHLELFASAICLFPIQNS